MKVCKTRVNPLSHIKDQYDKCVKTGNKNEYFKKCTYKFG